MLSLVWVPLCFYSVFIFRFGIGAGRDGSFIYLCVSFLFSSSEFCILPERYSTLLIHFGPWGRYIGFFSFPFLSFLACFFHGL
jgi:hypothetical protein